jgi:hypothetical protein
VAPSSPRYRNVVPVVGLRSSNVSRPEIVGAVTWSVLARAGSAWEISPASFSASYLSYDYGSEIAEP